MWSDVAYESANNDLALTSGSLEWNSGSDIARCVARPFRSGVGLGYPRTTRVCHLDISIGRGLAPYALALGAALGLLAGLEDVLERLVELAGHCEVVFGRRRVA